MIYISSNTDLQTIDTFELSLVHSIDYVIHVNTHNDNQVTYLTVTHDGTTTGELQESVVQSNQTPLDFSTDINLYECRILVQPTVANTEFIIEKTIRPCNLFSESTKSGKLIFANSGIGIDWESSLDNISIRSEGYNFYGDPAVYYVANTLGYVATKEELLTEKWISSNGSDLERDLVSISAVSSGQNPNFQYQEIKSVPGYSYHFSANAFYQIADEVVVKEGTQRQQGQCFIKIGKTPGSSEFANKNLSENEEFIDLIFHPDEVFYVSFGFGDRSNKAFLKNSTVKQIAPFHSWNKDQGSFYIKWNELANNQSLIDIGNIVIEIDSVGDVILNDTVIGSQEAINRLSITYDNEIRTSLNGEAVQINPAQDMNYLYEVDFINTPLKFSYFPVVLSNSGLIEVSTSG